MLTTLWSVDDQSSSVLLKYFYTYIAKGYKKDRALRQAKLDFLQEADPFKTHPYFWAAYIMIGDDSSVTIHQRYPVLTFVGVALLLAGLVLLVIKLLFRRKLH